MTLPYTRISDAVNRDCIGNVIQIDEVRQALENGMSLMYIGNTDDRWSSCMLLFELENRWRVPVRTGTAYGVCDNRDLRL